MLLASLYVANLNDHEKNMARLYRMFAEKIPAMSDFWLRLERDEKAHSGILETLNFKLKEEKVGFSSDCFALDAVKDSESRLAKDYEEFSGREVSREEALKYALKMEKELVEHAFFKIFESFTPNMRDEFEALRKHTEEHIARVQNAFDVQENPPDPEEIPS